MANGHPKMCLEKHRFPPVSWHSPPFSIFSPDASMGIALSMEFPGVLRFSSIVRWILH
jgi:hypothetical protein